MDPLVTLAVDGAGRAAVAWMSEAEARRTSGGGTDIRRQRRIRNLRGWERSAAAALFVIVGLLPIVRAGSVLSQGWHPVGDVAVIALRAQDVSTGDVPLLGQPTSADKLGAGDSFHPGPLE